MPFRRYEVLGLVRRGHVNRPVIALLHELGFSPADIAAALAPFRGASRRQEEIFRDARFRVFDDYVNLLFTNGLGPSM